MSKLKSVPTINVDTDGLSSSDTGYMLDMEQLFKLRKKIPSDIIESMESEDVEQLEDRIVRTVDAVAQSKHFLSTNRQIVALKDNLKELRAGPNDTVKLQTAIQQYARHLLETKGKL